MDIFFDIDGTIITKSVAETQRNKLAIARLAKKHSLYFATSLPYRHARQRTQNLWHFFQGGCFANGADLQLINPPWRKVTPINEHILKQLTGFQYRTYRHQGLLYKITVITKRPLPLFTEALHIIKEGDIYSITAQETSKYHGILRLAHYLLLDATGIVTVGNDLNDIPMLSHFVHSIAVPESPAVVQASATKIMAIYELEAYLDNIK